jgi:hypothetical protein
VYVELKNYYMKKVFFLFLALVASLAIQAQIKTKSESTGKNSDELQIYP